MNLPCKNRFLWTYPILLLISSSVFSQGRPISGVIFDEGTGQPLSGVNVTVSGRGGNAVANGGAVVTDSSGAFSIRAGDHATLVFTYIGYERVEYKIGSQGVIRIGMKKTDKSMDEVIVIDGIQGGNINTINPNDIESIEFLKDASSTAIYGYQGANGVVIVTTKKGRAGRVRVNYDGYYGENGFVRYPTPRVGSSYVNLRRAANQETGVWTSPANDNKIFGTEYNAIKTPVDYTSAMQVTQPDITAFNPNYYLRPVPLAELEALTNAASFGQNPGY